MSVNALDKLQEMADHVATAKAAHLELEENGARYVCDTFQIQISYGGYDVFRDFAAGHGLEIEKKTGRTSDGSPFVEYAVVYRNTKVFVFASGEEAERLNETVEKCPGCNNINFPRGAKYCMVCGRKVEK